MIPNHYPMWKNLFILIVILGAFLYAAPNLFVADPGVQISSVNPSVLVNANLVNKLQASLNAAQIPSKKIELQENGLLIRFSSPEMQLKAKELIETLLGKDYLVALSLVPSTPEWLKVIGATPMKLGLDLRGGVHFLYEVDVDSVLKQRIEGDLNNISQVLRTERVRYSDLTRQGSNGINLQFRAGDALDDAYAILNQHFPEFTWTKTNLTLQGVLSPPALQQFRQDTLEQAMNILRNRVNALF